MNATVSTLIGIVVVTLGLIGLGFALHPMMLSATDTSALMSVAGLGAFAVSIIVMMLWLRY